MAESPNNLADAVLAKSTLRYSDMATPQGLKMSQVMRMVLGQAKPISCRILSR